MSLHPLLVRQLRRFSLGEDSPRCDPGPWREFLGLVREMREEIARTRDDAA